MSYWTVPFPSKKKSPKEFQLLIALPWIPFKLLRSYPVTKNCCYPVTEFSILFSKLRTHHSFWWGQQSLRSDKSHNKVVTVRSSLHNFSHYGSVVSRYLSPQDMLLLKGLAHTCIKRTPYKQSKLLASKGGTVTIWQVQYGDAATNQSQGSFKREEKILHLREDFWQDHIIEQVKDQSSAPWSHIGLPT